MLGTNKCRKRNNCCVGMSENRREGLIVAVMQAASEKDRGTIALAQMEVGTKGETVALVKAGAWTCT